MKKRILLTLLAASTQSVHAQSIAAGTISLGGSIGYNQYSGSSSNQFANSNLPGYSTATETDGKQLYLYPAASYFVADNLAIGLVLGYSNGRRTDKAASTPNTQGSRFDRTTTISLRAGAFAQYYKMLTVQFGITGRLGAGYQRIKDDRDGNSFQNGIPNYSFTSATTNSGYYVDLTPGLVFFPVPKFGISASIGALSFNNYKLTNATYNDTNGNTSSIGAENKGSSFTANFGLDSFLLGGTYYFGR